MFKGIDKDDAEIYDTKEAALERARMLAQWSGDPNMKVMMQRHRVPLWFCHLVRGTWFEFLGYYEVPR